MKTVFITGVSSGLGNGLAKIYLERGYQVYGISRRTPKNLSSSTYPHFHFKSIDISQLDSLSTQINSFIDSLPEIETVFLNAGILGELSDLQDTSLESLQHMMDVNVWANKIICDQLFSNQRTIKQLIGISSGASVNGHRGWGGYALSKAALNMLIQLYAGERPHTHFCSLAPGLVDTAMQDYLCSLESEDQFPSIKKLKKARGTENMPLPKEAAQKIIDLLPHLLKLSSGSFADIRLLE